MMMMMMKKMTTYERDKNMHILLRVHCVSGTVLGAFTHLSSLKPYSNPSGSYHSLHVLEEEEI